MGGVLFLLLSVSSSSWILLSAADGIVGRNRTPRRPPGGGDREPERSRWVSSDATACCRTRRGFGPGIDWRDIPMHGKFIEITKM